MRWTAAIAGKSGRCKCGATVRVPKEIEPPAEIDLLDALAQSTTPVVESNIGYNAPPPVAASAAPAVPLQYQPQRPKAAGSSGGNPFSLELLREFYFPGAVLILGYVAMMAWLGYHGSLIAVAVITVLFLATLAMVVKTIILSLFAWYLASKTGGSFGNPLSTILKVAALVVALDAAIVWTLNAMVGLGMITRRGETYVVWVPLLDLFVVTLVVAALISRFLYGLRGAEANLFSRFIAGGNLAINLLVIFVLVMIGRSIANSAAQARLAPSVSVAPAGGLTVSAPPVNGALGGNSSSPNSSSANSSAGNSPMASSSAANAPAAIPAVPTTTPSAPAPVALDDALDRVIAMKLSKRGAVLMEGRDWVTSPQFRPQERPIGQLINQMYNLRSPKVYVETLRGAPD